MKPYFFGNRNANTVLIQMVGEHDLPLMEQEYSQLQALMRESRGDATNKEILLIAVKADNWNDDLSPWTAPPIFGKPPAPVEREFGDGAAKTLAWLQEKLIPTLECNPQDPANAIVHEKPGKDDRSLENYIMPQDPPRKKYYIGGYSLAGLFALWAAFQTDLFAGVAAVSPSVWFPGFREYAKTHPVKTDTIYLSLGEKEEKTRSQVMAQVGSAIRDIYEHLKKSNISCILEWNAGNHFSEPALRTAKGWAWLLKNSQPVARL